MRSSFERLGTAYDWGAPHFSSLSVGMEALRKLQPAVRRIGMGNDTAANQDALHKNIHRIAENRSPRVRLSTKP